MQTIIVALIIIAAALYVGRVFLKGFKKQGDCACGCTSCSLADSCTDPTIDSDRGPSAIRIDPPAD